MDKNLKTSLLMQFGAALDMFEEAVQSCPETLWETALWQDTEDPRYGQVWYLCYHTLSWLDLFLTGSRTGFNPPAPFIRGVLPEKPYAKEDIRSYLNHCRQKAQNVFENLTDEKANEICIFEWMEPSFLELQLYNMRHIQEHSSQLRYFLGQHSIPTNDWVARATPTMS